jgi:ADP-heptose:LPS heptosyltransferase
VRRQLVLVAPGSYRAFKRWDYLNYCEIIQRLDKVDVRVALIGGKEDAELAKRILMKVGRESVENLCGMVGFVELASLMEHAALLLTNDSAAMHLADLVGLKVIALFGITRPERCGPYSQTGNAIRSRNSESGSYSFGKFSKYDDTCINSIDIEEVWVAVASRIGIRI